MPKIKIYLASPLGFNPEYKHYLDKIKEKLVTQDHKVFCPWDQTQFAEELERIPFISDFQTRVDAYKEVAAKIGTVNEDGIRRCDVLLAVLDGLEVDSGTASELGFAAAIGKACYGLRTDVRDSGDFPGLPINLQVLHFIESSGGRMFRRIDDIEI
jgi:nucleoside 2-deoxyribosyltransferase